MTTLEIIGCFIFGIVVFSAGFLFGTSFGIYLGKKESEVAKRREDIEKSLVDCSTPSVTDSKGEAE